MYARASIAIALGCLVVSGCDPGSRGNKEGQVENLGTNTGENDWLGFNPTYFGVSNVAFGYDHETLQAVPVTTDDEVGNPVMLPITITVLLMAASAGETGQFTADNHCEVVMTSTESLPYADWTGDAGAWFAFELANSVGTTNCHELDFDPRDWGNNPVEHVTKWTWGAGINALTTAAVDVLGDDFPLFEPWVQGGGYYWEELPYFGDAKDPDGNVQYDADGYIDVGITYAYEVDADFKLALNDDEKILIPAEDVAQPNNNALTAYYEVQVNRFLKPALHLVLEPE